jgi:hypothetical protein
MADIIAISNTKKSRAEYFREYRKKQMLVKSNGTHQENLFKEPRRSFGVFKMPGVYITLIALLSLATTAYLVYLSSAFFEGSSELKMSLAVLSETLLLTLVILKPQSKIENMFRLVLLLIFCGYTVLPFVFQPVKTETQNYARLNILHLEQESLKREIQNLNVQHQEFVALQRITKAETVAQQIATRESELRNSYLQEKDHQEKNFKAFPAWVLSLQRLLFVAVNMFLVHHLASFFTTKTSPRKKRNSDFQLTTLCEV